MILRLKKCHCLPKDAKVQAILRRRYLHCIDTLKRFPSTFIFSITNNIISNFSLASVLFWHVFVFCTAVAGCCDYSYSFLRRSRKKGPNGSPSSTKKQNTLARNRRSVCIYVWVGDGKFAIDDFRFVIIFSYLKFHLFTKLDSCVRVFRIDTLFFSWWIFHRLHAVNIVRVHAFSFSRRVYVTYTYRINMPEGKNSEGKMLYPV